MIGEILGPDLLIVVGIVSRMTGNPADATEILPARSTCLAARVLRPSVSGAVVVSAQTRSVARSAATTVSNRRAACGITNG